MNDKTIEALNRLSEYIREGDRPLHLDNGDAITIESAVKELTEQQARIAELERRLENKSELAAIRADMIIKQAEQPRAITAEDVRRMVKRLKWEFRESEGAYVAECGVYQFWTKVGEVWETTFGESPHHFCETREDAKALAQKWFENHILAALVLGEEDK